MTFTSWEGASSDAAELTSKQDMNCTLMLPVLT